MKNIFLLVIVTIISLILYFEFTSNDVYKDDIPEILGLKNLEIKIDKSVQTFALRDDYLLEVYTLSDYAIQEFKKKKNKEIIFEFYDKLYPEWKKIGWIETPFQRTYNNILYIITNPGVENANILLELDNIKKLLSQPGSFYAFYYKVAPCGKIDKQNISATFIRFLLLDCNNNKLYVVEA